MNISPKTKRRNNNKILMKTRQHRYEYICIEDFFYIHPHSLCCPFPFSCQWWSLAETFCIIPTIRERRNPNESSCPPSLCTQWSKLQIHVYLYLFPVRRGWLPSCTKESSRIEFPSLAPHVMRILNYILFRRNATNRY